MTYRFERSGRFESRSGVLAIEMAQREELAELFLVDTMRGLPRADIAALLGGNAQRFYDVDVEKLDPLVSRIGPEFSAFSDEERRHQA